MKKIMLAAFCVSMLLTGVALASPLTDYSAGKVSIDVNYSKQGIDFNQEGWVQGFTKKGKWDFGGTFGLGNKFAVQYVQVDTGPNPTTTYDKDGNLRDGYTDSYKLHTQQFNVLYQLDKSFSVYTGIFRTNGTWTNYDLMKNYHSNTENIWQFGVLGYTKLADKLTGSASVGIGKNLNTYHIGLGYAFTPNLEFNIMYDYKKVKGLYDEVGRYDITAKGMKYGITYKF